MKQFYEITYRYLRAPWDIGARAELIALVEGGWEKFVPFYDVPFYQGEIEHRFNPYFEIEKMADKIDYSKWPPGYAVYLMTRKGETTR